MGDSLMAMMRRLAAAIVAAGALLAVVALLHVHNEGALEVVAEDQAKDLPVYKEVHGIDIPQPPKKAGVFPYKAIPASHKTKVGDVKRLPRSRLPQAACSPRRKRQPRRMG